jgi:hypothetical protein
MRYLRVTSELGKYEPPKLHFELSGSASMIQRAATPKFSLQNIQLLVITLHFKAYKRDDLAHHMHR